MEKEKAVSQRISRGVKMLKEILIANHDFVVISPLGVLYYFRHYEGPVFIYTTDRATGYRAWYYNMENSIFSPNYYELNVNKSHKDTNFGKSIEVACKKYLFQKQLKEVLHEG